MTTSAPTTTSALGLPAAAPGPPPVSSSPPIVDLSLEQLRDLVGALGHPAYRAEQVAAWVYRSTATGFDDMTNVPKPLRHALAERFRFHAL